MRHVILAAILGTAMFAGVAQAQTYKAENRVIVTGVGDGTFSVPSNSRFGARGAWCAAAAYGQDVLGASGTSRVYVQKAKTSNSAPVIFGLTPGGTTPVSVVSTGSSLRTPGSNLSVDHARQFCHDAKLRVSR